MLGWRSLVLNLGFQQIWNFEEPKKLVISLISVLRISPLKSPLVNLSNLPMGMWSMVQPEGLAVFWETAPVMKIFGSMIKKKADVCPDLTIRYDNISSKTEIERRRYYEYRPAENTIP